MNFIEYHHQNECILYDQNMAVNPEMLIFDPEILEQKQLLLGESLGRGKTYLFRSNNEKLFLRHYQRGGAIAPLLGDRYVWMGLTKTRPWREFTLLSEMYAKNLPVPKPLAVRVIRTGVFYTGDIITHCILNSKTLSERLSEGSLEDDLWSELGKVIRRFHDEGVNHADLNAHNILLDEQNMIYLIDFDNSRFMKNKRQHWKQENLSRLLRSLNKLKGLHEGFDFKDNDWRRLTSGYLGL